MELKGLNVLLKLQPRTSLIISQIPVQSGNIRVDKSHILGGIAPKFRLCKPVFCYLYDMSIIQTEGLCLAINVMCNV